MLRDRDEMKMLVLSIFRAIDEEMQQFLADEVIAASDMIEQMDYIETFNDLLSLNLLYRKENLQGTFCGITEKGKEVVREAERIYLAKSERERAVRLALKHYETKKTGIRYNSYIINADDENSQNEMNTKGFFLVYSVMKNNDILLETKVFFNDEYQAKQALANCNIRPSVVLSNLLAVLTGEVDYLNL